MGHPNLSPELNALVAAGKDPQQTLNMFNVTVGQKVKVAFGGNEAYFFKFEVVRPAGPHAFRDSAVGRIIECNLPTSKKEGEIVIVGACTRNPGAPLGMTMLQGSVITVGRHLAWGFADDDRAILLRDEVKEIVQMPT